LTDRPRDLVSKNEQRASRADAVAGSSPRVEFDEDACARICEMSGPAIVNVLCAEARIVGVVETAIQAAEARLEVWIVSQGLLRGRIVHRQQSYL